MKRTPQPILETLPSIETIRTDPRVALEVTLRSHRQQLGLAKLDRDAYVADGLDIPDAILATITRHEQGIEATAGGLAELARRAVAMTAAEKAAVVTQAAAVNFNVRQQLRTLVLEEDQHIARQADWSKRLWATVALAKGLGDEALKYECAQITRGLRYHLGYALRQFPGLDAGATPFMKLDQCTFESVFSEPVDPSTVVPRIKTAKTVYA